MKLFSPQQKGFTLIEIIVSIALFTVVALVAIGALLKVIDANKKSQNMKTVITNLNFALESMSRELRVGTKYHCQTTPLYAGITIPLPESLASDSCDATGNWTIYFESAKTYPNPNPTCNLIHAYSYDGANLYKAEQEICSDNITNDDYTPIIYSRNVGEVDPNEAIKLNETPIFSQSNFKVKTGPGIQPYVQIHLFGTAGSKQKVESYFDVQTTISQRSRD